MGDLTFQSQFNFPLLQAPVRLKRIDPIVDCDIKEIVTKMFNFINMLTRTAEVLGKL